MLITIPLNFIQKSFTWPISFMIRDSISPRNVGNFAFFTYSAPIHIVLITSQAFLKVSFSVMVNYLPSGTPCISLWGLPVPFSHPRLPWHPSNPISETKRSLLFWLGRQGEGWERDTCRMGYFTCKWFLFIG